MESDAELARWAGEWVWPLILAGAAAFSFWALLAYEHLKLRALVDLLAAAAARRLKAGASAERARTLEEGVRRVLAREGLKRP